MHQTKSSKASFNLNLITNASNFSSRSPRIIPPNPFQLSRKTNSFASITQWAFDFILMEKRNGGRLCFIRFPFIAVINHFITVFIHFFESEKPLWDLLQ
jgi:hypothetical protein